MNVRILPVAIGLAFAAYGQSSTALKPPKPDVPYIKQADNLIPTEVVQAQEEKKKNDSTFVIQGAASTAKTPMTLPIFLFESDKIPVDSLQLYRLEVKNGRREITLGKKTEPIRLQVTPVQGKLFRIEVYDGLEAGQYSISPNNSNTAFCFEIID